MFLPTKKTTLIPKVTMLQTGYSQQNHSCTLKSQKKNTQNRIINLKLRENQIRPQLLRRRIPGLAPHRQRQRLNNRQENPAGPRRRARHGRGNQRLAHRQPVRQPQRALPQPLDKVHRDPVPQARLHKPSSKKEGDHDQPNHLIREGAERGCES